MYYSSGVAPVYIYGMQCLSSVYYTFDVCVYRMEYFTYLAHLRTNKHPGQTLR